MSEGQPGLCVCVPPFPLCKCSQQLAYWSLVKDIVHALLNYTLLYLLPLDLGPHLLRLIEADFDGQV